MTNKVEFEYDTLIEILDGDSERYQVVENEITDVTRWGNVYYLVFLDLEEQTYWQTMYELGATEHQESMPFEYPEDRECVQVRPVPVTKFKYEEV